MYPRISVPEPAGKDIGVLAESIESQGRGTASEEDIWKRAHSTLKQGQTASPPVTKSGRP
jgi:hypothetical protein